MIYAKHRRQTNNFRKLLVSICFSVLSSIEYELFVYGTLMASRSDGFPAAISKAREGYVPVAELDAANG